MFLIGEKLNSSIPSSFEAMNTKNEEKLLSVISSQVAGGADFLDVNAALCTDEASTLEYIIGLILANSSCGIMLDSPSPEILTTSIGFCSDRPVIINSVTCSERFSEVVPVVKKLIDSGRDISLVLLPIDGSVPSTIEERRVNIDLAMTKLRKAGIPDSRIYMDLITEGVATDPEAGSRFFDSLRFTKEKYPNVKTTCGLSNISFGLPKRIKINSAFLSICIALGLDSAIMDTSNSDMIYALRAALMLLGRDEYCMNYISYYRENENQGK